MCIFGGKTAREFDIEDIKAGKRLILNTWEELKRNADQQAHPFVVLRVALGKL